MPETLKVLLSLLGTILLFSAVAGIFLFGSVGLVSSFYRKPKNQPAWPRYSSEPLDVGQLDDMTDYYVYWIMPDGKEICAICEWFAEESIFKMWDPFRRGNDITIKLPSVTAVYPFKIADNPITARRAL